jgi:serine/threonine-protein kinase
MLYKCLEKEPRNRFANGKELHDFIALNSALMTHKEETSLAIVDTIEEDNERLLQERDQLQREVLRYQQALQEKETVVARLQQTVQDKEAALLAASSQPVQASRASAPIRQQGVSKGAFYSLLLLTLLLGGLAAFALLKDREPEERIAGSNMNTPKDTLIAQDQSSAKSRVVEKERRQPAAVPPKPVAKEPTGNTTTKAATVNEEQRATDIAAAKEERKREEENRNRKKDEARETDKGATTGERYKVISRAYFHNEPSAETRRNAFIVHWNNAVLRPVEERDGYVYVIFTNTEGQTSKGWLDKKDLRKLE